MKREKIIKEYSILQGVKWIMKKLSQLLIIACFMILNVQFVSAATVWSDENTDLSQVHGMVVCEPNYSETKGSEITGKAVAEMIYNQAQPLKGLYALSVAEIEKNILRDSGVNVATIKATDEKKAEEAFLAGMAKYADAYLVTTVVHNSRVMIFYDVYSTKTNKPIFTYQIVAGSDDPDSLATYQTLTKKFYREFQKAAKK